MLDPVPDVATPTWKVPALATLLGVIVVPIFAWRLALGADGSGFDDRGVVLALAALQAAIAVLLAARGRTDANARPWLLVAAACVAWGASHPAQLSDDRTATIAFNAGFALFVAMVACGVVSFGARAADRDARRKLILDLVSPVVALLVLTWLVLVGPYVLNDGAGGQMKTTAVVHGAGAIVLLVLGLAGPLSRRGGEPGAPPRALLAGVGSIALGDGLWLQRWIDGASRINLLAELCFASGFLLVAFSALR
ncbi:MAG: hypothetical protein ACR2OO_01905, partial [Thermomicrobiales bacterium]